MKGTLMELLAVSPCVQNAVNNRVRWLYHNPTAMVGHTIHNVDISHLPSEHLRRLAVRSRPRLG